MLLSMAAYSDNVTIDGIYYQLDGSTKQAVVTSGRPIYDGDIIIPASVQYNGVNYNVVKIGNHAFANCNIGNVTLPNSVTAIGDQAFQMSKLTSIVMPNVKEIGSYAFYSSYIKQINIPNSVTSIGSYAFDMCNSLESVNIGKGLTAIEQYTFTSCIKLAKVTFANGSNVKTIGGSAFKGCTSLESIQIPSSVTTIDEWAFANCTKLKSITVSSGVIGNYAFQKDTALETVVIGKDVQTIGSSAFDDCNNLSSVTINGSGLTSIGSGAFSKCSKLTNVNISDLAAWCKIKFEDNPVTHAQHLFLNGSEVKNLTIAGTITTISEKAFEGAVGIKTITFKEGVEIIENNAFKDCANVTSISIPKTVTRIFSGAFSGCNSVEKVTITDLSAWLKTDVGSLPSSYNLYLYGEKVVDLFIPDDNTWIYGGHFQGCESIKSVKGKHLTVIGSSAFSSCSNLELLSLPNSLEEISYGAFSYCMKLTNVYSYALSCPKAVNSWGGTAFDNDFPYEYATLHVPPSALEKYKATAPWSNFGKIVAYTKDDPNYDPTMDVDDPGSAAISNVNDDAATDQAPVFDLSGRKLDGLPTAKGVYIVNGRKVLRP